MKIRQVIFGVVEYESDESLEVLQDELTERLQSNTDNLEGTIEVVDDEIL